MLFSLVTGPMEFNITKGPFREGQNILIKCQVPRANGNITKDNLKVFLKGLKLDEPELKHNTDGTKMLSFHYTHPVSLSDQHANISCQYFTEKGILHKFFIIDIVNCK